MMWTLKPELTDNASSDRETLRWDAAWTMSMLTGDLLRRTSENGEGALIAMPMLAQDCFFDYNRRLRQ